MSSEETSTNPYASPRTVCRPAKPATEQDPRRQMRVVIRLYWWMGVIGIVPYSVFTVWLCFDWALGGSSTTGEHVGGLVVGILQLAVFTSSIHVARRLATRPEGMLPRARLAGIILATLWFPILTVPGIICVRRVTRHFAAYCAMMRADRGNATIVNKA